MASLILMGSYSANIFGDNPTSPDTSTRNLYLKTLASHGKGRLMLCWLRVTECALFNRGRVLLSGELLGKV